MLAPLGPTLVHIYALLVLIPVLINGGALFGTHSSLND